MPQNIHTPHPANSEPHKPTIHLSPQPCEVVCVCVFVCVCVCVCVGVFEAALAFQAPCSPGTLAFLPCCHGCHGCNGCNGGHGCHGCQTCDHGCIALFAVMSLVAIPMCICLDCQMPGKSWSQPLQTMVLPGPGTRHLALMCKPWLHACKLM